MRLDSARPSGSRTVGMADHLDPEVEVGDHPADDGQLLEVLLAEHRHVGPDGAEELGHHRGHAVEVARAGGALQSARRVRRPSTRGLERRAGTWPRRSVRTRRRRRASRTIARSSSIGRGYWSKSSGRSNCSGLTKIVTTADIGASTGLVDQREVPRVERTHRRHDGRSSAAPRAGRATTTASSGEAKTCTVGEPSVVQPASPTGRGRGSVGNAPSGGRLRTACGAGGGERRRRRPRAAG